MDPTVWPRALASGFASFNPTTERQRQVSGTHAHAALVASIHTRRSGTVEDIAAATLPLASTQAGRIGDQVLAMDGGRS